MCFAEIQLPMLYFLYNLLFPLVGFFARLFLGILCRGAVFAIFGYFCCFSLSFVAVGIDF